ncbi:hypothetical protein [Streptomyces sp. NBC_00207]|uniref:hypothetical protein n=1 Tax=unclassified Streptomyces TaxID=2593676 RepID=UPI0028848676|nr:hypothetical protein [Streptomyces sp. DSM 41633]
MTHDLHTRATVQSQRRILRIGMVLTSAAFVSGAIVLPASAVTAIAHHSPVTSRTSDDPNRLPGSNQCKSGYVWRDSFEGDGLCVTPAERDAAHASNPNRQPGSNQCKPGYVWRDSFDGDGLCVTPAERAAAKR